MVANTRMAKLGLSLTVSALLAPTAAWNLFGPRLFAARGGKLGMATHERMAFSPKSAGKIGKGDMLPMDATFRTVDKKGRVTKLSAPDAFCGKKVLLVTMPAAHSPTCTMRHLPNYIRANEAGLFAAHGVDAVAVLTTDEPEVLKDWVTEVKEETLEELDLDHLDGVASRPEGEPVKFIALSDPTGEFCRCAGLELNQNEEVPVYERSAMLIKDGKVKVALMENGADYSGRSSAENMLAEGLGCKESAVFIALAEELGLVKGNVCPTD